ILTLDVECRARLSQACLRCRHSAVSVPRLESGVAFRVEEPPSGRAAAIHRGRYLHLSAPAVPPAEGAPNLGRLRIHLSLWGYHVVLTCEVLSAETRSGR